MEEKLNRLRAYLDQKLARLAMTDGLKNRIRLGIRKKKLQRRWFYGTVSAATAAALLALVLLPGLPKGPQSFVPPQNGGAEFQLLAEKAEAGMVATDSGFLLSSPVSLTSEDVQRLVVFTPETPFTVERRSAQSYRVVPRELAENTVYSIALAAEERAPLSWAFQTTGALTLTASMPRDLSFFVPVDTGLEFSFSGEPVNFKNNFTISPATEGKLEPHGKTMVFVPAEPLAFDTVYTVTLGAAIADTAKRTLEKDVTVSFRTAADDSDARPPYLYVSGDFNESFLPSDPVVIGLYADLDKGSAQVSLYPLSGEQYARFALEQAATVNPTLGRSSDYLVSTQGLQAAQTFEAPFQKPSDYTPAYLPLPANPGPGHYLADLFIPYAEGAEPLHLQKLIQVSSAAVYTQSQNGQTLLWVNDSQTGQPAANAAVSLKTADNLVSGKTDSRGLVSLETGKASSAQLSIALADGPYLDLVSLVPAAKTEANRLYYHVLYTDRQAYLPTDTLHFWGTLLPRSGAALPREVTVTFDEATAVTVPVKPNGSYEGALSFSAHEPATLSLFASVGDSALTGLTVEIMHYEKPTHVLTLTPDKPFYRGGETVKPHVSATYFDGTPAKALELSLRADSSESLPPIVLDEEGNGSFAVPVPPAADPFALQWMSLSATCTELTDAACSAQISVPCFPSGCIAQTASRQDGALGFSVSANELNFAAAAKLTESEGVTPAMLGKGAELQGSAVILRRAYVARETGSYYDFIAKKNIPTYDYEQVTTRLTRFDFALENGVYESPQLPYAAEAGVNYEAVVTLSDQNGNTAQRTIYLNQYPTPLRQYGAKQYAFHDTVQREGVHPSNALFSETKPAKLQLTELMGAVSQGTALYTAVQDDIFAIGLTQNGVVSLPFEEKQVPNFYVYGAYFDGAHIFPVQPAYCSYDYPANSLQLELTTDKERYRPGETVNAAVKITDKQGAPVSANFVLSTVDEAAFAVRPQAADPLALLYQPIYSPILFTSASYFQYSASTEFFAEGGGEGDAPGIRRDFADTASFLSGTTGPDGAAKLSYQLPHNLTSWRLTAVAVAELSKPAAGSTTKNIFSSVPYFITPVMNQTNLQGDDIVFALRSGGLDIASDARTDYKVTLWGNGKETVKTLTHAASLPALFSFGKLPAGNYTVLFQGSCGGLTDGVERSFTVSDSLLTLRQTQQMELSQLTTLAPAAYPVSLAFFDQADSLTMEALAYLESADGPRSDFIVARNLAGKKLAALGEQPLFEEEPLTDLQQFVGGMRLFPYSAEDPLLTAKLCLAAPDSINTLWAKTYFYNLLYDKNASPSQVTAAYLGLAALREPVLFDLLALLPDPAFSLEEQTLLAYGLAVLGDTATAAAWYDAHLLPLTKAQGAWRYLDAGRGADYALTAQGAVLAALCGQSDAPALLSYVMHTSSKDYAAPIDLAAFVQRAPAPKSSDAAFSYVKDGKTQTVALRDGIHFVSMNQEQLAAAKFTLLKGNVCVSASYTGSPNQASLEKSIRIHKTTEALSDGNTLVTLSADFGKAPNGTYVLTDLLPAGGRFVKALPQENRSSSLLSAQGNKLTFSLTKGSPPIQYVLRTALPGDYVLEQTAVVHCESGTTGLSPRGRVTLN